MGILKKAKEWFSTEPENDIKEPTVEEYYSISQEQFFRKLDVIRLNIIWTEISLRPFH